MRVLCVAAMLATLVVSPRYDLAPGVDSLEVAQSPIELDLTALSPREAADAAAGMSVRLRWPESRVALVTDRGADGALLLRVRAASAGGARLLVHNGQAAYTKKWGDGPTHTVNADFAVPLPAGPRRVLVLATEGTVVLERYSLMDATDEVVPEDAEVLEADPAFEQRKMDGYRGIWYSNQATNDEYVWKYSGGLGTYCAKHIPLAVYAPEVNKTFFVYGGRAEDANRLLMMVGCYDHATGLVSRPTMILDRNTVDAHENPVLSIDADGYLWVFPANHGPRHPSYIFRSAEPYSIEAFDLVAVTNTSYPQPHHIPGKGFLFLHTIYMGGRMLHWMTSADGLTWSEPEPLAMIEMGHYQVSWEKDGLVGTAFNYHPEPDGLNFRTNLYYLETRDMGQTWTTAGGAPIEAPLREVVNPALVRDYEAEGLKVYMKGLSFDAQSHPVILYVTSGGWEPGPENGPRTWMTAQWTGAEWRCREIAEAYNNYDTGCLHIEEDGTWRLIAPTDLGPQPYNPGGEMVMWVSRDEGETWERVRQLTHHSPYNHTYARLPKNAHPGFCAFWADGHGRQESESRLYFCTQEGDVYRLPAKMTGDFASPERVE